MKQMVNAFSEYARAPDMHFTRFDLNQLITEVVDLYRAQDSSVELKLLLDPTCRIFRRTACASGRFSTIW
jgi:nitrogen fixation/metabolism regulation signal transduction histidine kinase